MPGTRRRDELGPAGDDCDRRWGGRRGSLRRRGSLPRCLKRGRGCWGGGLGESRSRRWCRGGSSGRRDGAEEELLLGNEVRELAHARGGRVLGAFGSRHRLTLDAQTLRANIPDLSERDVFICGPERFTTMVAGAARRAGVARARLHVEGFGA